MKVAEKARKVPSEIPCGFDPEQWDSAVKDNRIALALWAGIKSQHIVPQYFSDLCLRYAKIIEESDPQTYDDFKAIISGTPLSVYGIIYPDKDPNAFRSPVPTMNDHFWRSMWEIVSGKRELTLVYDPQK